MPVHHTNNLFMASFLAVSMVSSAGAVDLLIQDFSTSDGGFTVTNENHDDPWAYDAGAGAWSTDGSANGAPDEHTRLTSPELTVDADGGYAVIFDHRYDIEGGDWDGAALYISVNGGSFDYVEGAEFTENGYNTGNLIGAHALLGLTAFGGISSGHAEGTYITSLAGPFAFSSGDIVEIQFLMANDQGAVGTMTPNWEIDRVSVVSLLDSDSDGMPDFYEEANGLDKTMNDAAGDPDSDDSSNLDEYLAGTDPQDDDSDDDGLKDGVEDGTGTFVSAAQTGSDPSNPDTDGDGLADGGGTFISATQTGSDPNEADTDGDRQNDGFEVTNSTDPNDAGSKSAVATVTTIAGLLEGDLTDPENDGVEGDTIPADGDIPQTAGTNFNWISIAASSEEYFGNFGGSEGSFDVFDNLTGGGQNKVCCNGAPQDITVGFENPVSLTHLTLTSSNDTPARDPLDFQIQGSNDGVTFDVIYDRADDISLWGARNETVRIDLPDASDAYTFIRYAVSRTGGANHALAEIEYFGEEGAITPPEITSVNHNSVTNQVTLTWNSRDNKTYSVFTSTDLTDFSEDINDSIPSEGDTTTFTFTLFEPVDLRRFFRVELNE
jgi:hypothetical protein